MKQLLLHDYSENLIGGIKGATWCSLVQKFGLTKTFMDFKNARWTRTWSIWTLRLGLQCETSQDCRTSDDDIILYQVIYCWLVSSRNRRDVLTLGQIEVSQLSSQNVKRTRTRLCRSALYVFISCLQLWPMADANLTHMYRMLIGAHDCQSYQDGKKCSSQILGNHSIRGKRKDMIMV